MCTGSELLSVLLVIFTVAATSANVRLANHQTESYLDDEQETSFTTENNLFENAETTETIGNENCLDESANFTGAQVFRVRLANKVQQKLINDLATQNCKWLFLIFLNNNKICSQ